MNRVMLVLCVSLLLAGCELVGDVFQAGLVVGIVVVLVVVGLIGWVVSKMRGRGKTP